MSRDAFGRFLRRHRLRQQVTLDQIETQTRIPAALLEGLEAGDLSAWPSGIYARAYVRQYALAVGLDPEEAVDEFCRCYPEGDRRAGRTVREHAALIGHETTWTDELPPDLQGIDRRGTPPGNPPPTPAGRYAPPSLAMMIERLRQLLGRA